MTRPHTLSLDDQQLKIVQMAARLLPLELHEWFFRRVADELASIRRPTDDEVRLAIQNVFPFPLDMLFDQREGPHTLDLFDEGRR